VPDEDKKRAAHRALVDRVLKGEGRASPEQRARAFLSELLPGLIRAPGRVLGSGGQDSVGDVAPPAAVNIRNDSERQASRNRACALPEAILERSEGSGMASKNCSTAAAPGRWKG
jgi:hypothetical protein